VKKCFSCNWQFPLFLFSKDKMKYQRESDKGRVKVCRVCNVKKWTKLREGWFFNYEIKKFGGIVCYAGSITLSCDAPSGVTFELVEDGGGFNLEASFVDCGDDCHTLDATYTQLLPTSGTPDTGTHIFVVDCPPVNPYSHTLSPSGTTEGVTVRYKIEWEDCCGNVGTDTVTFTPPCVGPTLPPTLSIVLVGSVYYLRQVYVDCGDTCHNANFSFTQNNLFVTGTNDTGINNANVIPCAGPFPETIDYALSPNLDIIPVQTTIRYYITITDCCGNVIPNILVTYPRP